MQYDPKTGCGFADKKEGTVPVGTVPFARGNEPWETDYPERLVEIPPSLHRAHFKRTRLSEYRLIVYFACIAAISATCPEPWHNRQVSVFCSVVVPAWYSVLRAT